MILSNLLSITANAYLSAAIWALVILIILYLARSPVHRLLGALGNTIYRATRTLAAATVALDKKLAERNRRVLLAVGRAHIQRMLVREFKRIHSMVVKNVEGYPKIQRQLSEIIARLENDYASSADAPPRLPEWIPVIKTISEIDHGEDTLMGKMLKEIHHSLTEQQKKAAEAYRQATAKRHRILAKWMPLWRKIQNHLMRTESAIAKLSIQAETIDRYMSDYEAIEKTAGQTEDILRANAWKQFFISSFVLAISIGVGFLNYQLLSQATGAMITGIDGIGPLSAHQTTALVVVLTVVGIGVFLMEALRVTHIFPSIGSMDEVLRRRFVLGSALLMLLLAAFQGLMIYLAPGTATQTYGTAVLPLSSHWLSRIGPTTLGVILPLILGLVAIPLETFATSARAIGGFLARVLLTVVATGFRLTGSLACAMTRLLTTCYDFIIFPAVWIEDAVLSGRKLPSDNPTGSARAMHQAVSESSDS